MRREELSSSYEDLGFVQSIPVLSPAEVRHFRAEIDRTCAALGGGVARLDAPHLFFDWAWELSTHPCLLDRLEDFVGPEIALRSTRLFYKHGGGASFVGWHQDGIVEKLDDGRVPAVWLALTATTVANGCLRVVPRSHRRGLIPHADRPDPDNLTTLGATALTPIDGEHDIVMQAGEMSLHHPLLLHGSLPNGTPEPRIGFSATYAPAQWAHEDAIRVRGGEPAKRPELFPAAGVDAYRHSGYQIVYDRARCPA
jgi:non-haem Fe2+, alpha-ketoglutarate-dependent halogenase